MDQDQQRVWAVRPRRGPPIPIASEEAALFFRAAGWQVTELPLGSLTDEEMRSIGIEPDCDHDAD